MNNGVKNTSCLVDITVGDRNEKVLYTGPISNIEKGVSIIIKNRLGSSHKSIMKSLASNCYYKDDKCTVTIDKKFY